MIFCVTRLIKTTKDEKDKRNENYSLRKKVSSCIAPENIKETFWGRSVNLEIRIWLQAWLRNPHNCFPL
jgi:hypothetical protein